MYYSSGAHGDSTKIHGMYLWQQSDWFIETAPKPDEKKSTRNNNLHFGQIFMDPDDFLLMSTDGKNGGGGGGLVRSVS